MVLDSPLGGYTHWMAFTPYPSDEHENPSIVASSDGITWVVPAGLTNPLDPIAGDPPMVNGSLYNSDTELVHVDGTLYLIWRRYDNGRGIFYLRASTNGVTWTPRQIIFDGRTTGEGAVSPFIEHIPAGDGTPEQWRMWYGEGFKLYLRTAPAITGPWSARQLCTVLGFEPRRTLWHFDAIPHDGILIGLFTATVDGATNVAGTLYIAASRDGTTWAIGPALVQAWPISPGWPEHWDSSIIYRCTGVVDGDHLRIWYSAMPKIGYTEVPMSIIKSALDMLPS